MERLNLTYRHWFFLALLILVNIAIFGCVVLALFEKVQL